MKEFAPRRFSEEKFTNQKKAAKSGRGFTLTEILISILTFLIIVVVVYSIQLLSQKAYRDGEMATEILQNGRVILEKMSREIRQAESVITSLPEVPDDPEFPPTDEILFQDGHVSPIVESDFAQGGGSDTIVLTPVSSSEDDYYKDAFVKIVEGTGSNQIRKIASYDGQTKAATVSADWETVPLAGISRYRIDSSYYYIKYWKDADNYLKKQIVGYCLSDDCVNFVFSPWNAEDEFGQTLYQLDSKLVLEEDTIGEFLTGLEFWGSKVINVSLILEKEGEQIELQTKIFGRNL